MRHERLAAEYGRFSYAWHISFEILNRPALRPPLTPQRLVAGLLAEKNALRNAAPGLADTERAVLLRPGAPDAWTVADVPLLDEAAQLLGTDDSAERARRHVIVDEAQELSAMAWRMVMRRIPTRSVTVVGDVAQRSSAAG